jgi:hypothetical protein
MSNVPTFKLDAVSVIARNAQYADTPLSDVDGDGSYNTYLGCNRAGSCANGIGIATDVIDPKLQDWSILNQGNLTDEVDPAARIDQASQHIGGDGLGDGDRSDDVINLILDQHGTPDFNDDCSYIAAVVQAAVGAGYNTADADPVNRDGRTIEIAERLWGSMTNA